MILLEKKLFGKELIKLKEMFHSPKEENCTSQKPSPFKGNIAHPKEYRACLSYKHFLK